MRRRWLVLVALVAAIAAWWTFGAPRVAASSPTADPPAAEPPPAVGVAPAREAREVPAVTPPPAAAPAPSAEESAEHRLATAMGLGWVSCPQPSVGIIRWGAHGDQPSDRFWFRTDQPSGVVLSWADFEVAGAVRWSINPDGTTTCAEEPLRRETATIRVVDRSGAPIAGVYIDSRPTGADGVGTVPLYNGVPKEVTLVGGVRVWVHAGDDIEVVLDSTEIAPDWSDWYDRLETFRAELEALDGLLADEPGDPLGGLSAAERGMLTVYRDDRLRMQAQEQDRLQPDGTLGPRRLPRR